jgi:Phosphate-selective porin O and P
VNRHTSSLFAAAALVALIKPALAQTAAPAALTVEPPPPPAPGPPAAANAELEKQLAVQRADLDEQDARIQELEHQIKEINKPAATPPKAGAKPDNSANLAAPTGVEKFPLKLGGYLQIQYEGHQDSEDQLLPGGAPLNQNRFLIRRARVKLTKDWQYGGVMFELDANTVKGAAVGVQHAEVSLAYRNQDLTPLVQVTLGLFDNPFGREVVESPRERPFMERSYASREFFPAEPDLGLRVSGQAAFFRYAVAVVNGQPLGDRTGFALQDPNAHKDVLGRVGVDVTMPSGLRVLGGVSVLNGRGFHAGTDATKNTLTWKDNISEDGLVQIPEIIGLPGAPATPSQNFSRWLLGADLGCELTSKFGTTHLFGEISVASNMDRNIFIADPVTTGLDEREFGYYVAVYHEFTSGPIVGFRYDSYNPNSDFLDSRGGKLLPVTQTVSTYSPLVGFQVPHKARLVAQYDVIKDALGRNELGVPVDKKNNVWTIRLQGEL